jgi:hypothetical protein
MATYISKGKEAQVSYAEGKCGMVMRLGRT